MTGSYLNDDLPTVLLAGLGSTQLAPITLPLDLTAAGVCEFGL